MVLERYVKEWSCRSRRGRRLTKITHDAKNKKVIEEWEREDSSSGAGENVPPLMPGPMVRMDAEEEEGEDEVWGTDDWQDTIKFHYFDHAFAQDEQGHPMVGE